MKQCFLEGYNKHHDLEAEVQFFEERQKDKAETRTREVDLRRQDQALADQEDEDKEEMPESRTITVEQVGESKIIIIPKDK